MHTAVFILCGYLSGSVLYARVFAWIMKKEGMIESSRDQNPGTANAFMYGGFCCGVCTLLCDLLKGFLPVFLYLHSGAFREGDWFGLSLVLAAPVIGHVLPLFYRFKGGKGIATTFGCLLGLFPKWRPAVILAVFFLFFSLVLRISTHFYRTLAAYLCALVGMLLWVEDVAVLVGFIVMAVVVSVRMLTSKEEKEKAKVRLLWMH